MFKVQIAFQGGGAKIVDLLAAAQAIQEIESLGKIEVTRVAGTSAGAIVACLFASGQPLDQIRQRLADIGAKELSRLFPRTANWRRLTALFRGRPLADEIKTKRLIGKFFNLSQGDELKDLKKPVFITAADILNGRKKVFSSTEDGNEKIVDCLMHSCALPYIFRAHSNLGSSPIVDGGICENLPSDELCNDEHLFGKVIGISFERNEIPKPPASLLDFSKALLETAMGNSMDRARRLIGTSSVFSIQTTIGTFDFEKAFGEGLGDHYSLIRMQVQQWFDKRFLVEQTDSPTDGGGIFTGNPWKEAEQELRETMRSLNQVYEAQFASDPLAIQRTCMIVTAYSLLAPGDPRSKNPDVVKLRRDFKTGDKAIHCYRARLGSHPESKFEPVVSWRLRDASGDHIKVTPVPVLSNPTPAPVGNAPTTKVVERNSRSVLLFFEPLLSPGGACYTLVQQSLISRAMDPLKQGSDKLKGNNHRPYPIDRMDLVLFAPTNFPKISMQALPRSSEGRSLSSVELQEFGDPPPGFRALGWTGTTILPGTSFGVKLTT